MKLRNKKTGQLGNFIINKDHFECCDLDYVPEYTSLSELNEEWEDYEKPKEYFYIDSACKGGIDKAEIFDCEQCEKVDDFNKSIGNYFLSKKEAEKAVEKLKAWKRLRDKGFKIEGWLIRSNYDGEIINVGLGFDKINKSIAKDLDLLFSSEED